MVRWNDAPKSTTQVISSPARFNSLSSVMSINSSSLAAIAVDPFRSGPLWSQYVNVETTATHRLQKITMRGMNTTKGKHRGNDLSHPFFATRRLQWRQRPLYLSLSLTLTLSLYTVTLCTPTTTKVFNNINCFPLSHI